MKRKIILFITILVSLNLYSQNKLDFIKGVWIIYDFKGTNGKDEYNFMTDWVAQQFINDTLFINDKIFLKHHNKTTDKGKNDACKSFLPKIDCDCLITHIKQVKNINDYLFDTFGIRPIQVGLDKLKDEILIFHTNCSDDYYKEIYMPSNKELWIHNFGMLFKLKKIDK